ncbi:HNH endonuclease signature motif containing protein [Enteractinococcus coprophilus]|uniref:HNH nuclease domain-containing protein n=1 Tax=Enteractinococcus coprophilus TaxID=1027633 RepID=A0A543AMF8_9MICC|nr:HNH endonuclease signature motif containing protein [Enteractinococcus coprophilus]TQL73748.1 hypothetical protein FB556_0192 [Enteractinococcus coprophilus]
MVATNAFPDIGVAVPMPDELDLNAIRNLSPGQLAYLDLVVSSEMSQRMADPATTFAQYTRVSGADWSGHEPQVENTGISATASQHTASGDDPTHADGTPVIPARPLPTAPECRYDTVPMIAEMMRRKQHLQEATMTSFARHLQPMFNAQPEYFGSPEGVTAFKDSTAYFKEVLRFSGQLTKKIHDRLPYVTWNPGQDPTLGMHQPKLLRLAAVFTEGNIPAENLDRIIWLDQDLSKYVHKTNATPEKKDAILKEFEPTLIEAAEASSPDAFNAARRRWADKIAHALDADGPPVAQTLRKKADNVIHDQAYSDGSGKMWMHATPDVYAEFKNFAVNQLNKSGAPLKTDEKYTEWLFGTTAESQDPNGANAEDNKVSPGDDHGPMNDAGLFDDFEADHPLNTAMLDDLSIDRDPETVVAEDEHGNPTIRKDLDTIEQLTPGQLVTAILLGAFKAIFSMDPDELQVKRSHGADSTLVIVQDIETAYKTLDIGALPADARRPRDPDGILPTVLKRPNPDDPNTLCKNPDHVFGVSPPPWTGYISEALNVGALHPGDAQKLACDSQIVGQIWNNHHSVLNQRRTYRTFTPTQRRAILARDRGCQAPGCTIIAAWCQIHHLRPWELGGTTDMDNAISLCAVHHAAVHNGKWTIRTINGAHFFQPAPWLDPNQPLLRNMYWAI